MAERDKDELTGAPAEALAAGAESALARGRIAGVPRRGGSPVGRASAGPSSRSSAAGEACLGSAAGLLVGRVNGCTATVEACARSGAGAGLLERRASVNSTPTLTSAPTLTSVKPTRFDQGESLRAMEAVAVPPSEADSKR